MGLAVPPGDDDAPLLAAWCAGDKHAGASLVERHFASIYRFFHNKVAGDVDDLVQRTFVSCLEAQPSFRGECSFRSLLFRIARRRLHDYFRERRRDAALDFTTTSLKALGTTPSAALWRKDLLQNLQEVLVDLPVDTQILIELRYAEGLSTQQLAQVFDVPEGTIKRRQFEARAQLRAALRERGYGAYMRTHLAGSATAWSRNQGTASWGLSDGDNSSATR